LKKITVPYETSGLFNKIILDYARNSDALAPFFGLPPKVESYQRQMEQAAKSVEHRAIISNQLLQAYQDFGITLQEKSPVYQNILKLKNNNAFTITTGHQLCLFTGPLYFIHKIISTIKWCQNLKRNYPEQDFIPVYWMASEDHDFEEINHLYLNQQKRSWNIDSKNQPVGRIKVHELDELFKEIESLSDVPEIKQSLIELTDCYSTSANLSEATFKLVHHLFSSYGVVVIEPDHHQFKKLFIPFLINDILHELNHQALSDTNIKLKVHYPLQVNGRNINCFYLNEQGRNLIKKTNKGYEAEGTNVQWNTEQLLDEINKHPERFSPNVILRPLYQECLLPNLSYIGGPGEIAYWLQLKQVFEVNQLPFPILTLRAFNMIMKESDANKLISKKLAIEDLFNDDLSVSRKLVKLNNDGGQQAIISQIDSLMQQFIEIADKTDNTISSVLIKQKSQLNTELTHINKKLDAAQRKKIANEHALYSTIKNKYFIGKTPQERWDNLINYAKLTGVKPFIAALIENTDVDQHHVQIHIHAL
jgi:bacillithiol biosynthesis cysteine-adding enzyme BshC